MGNATKFLAALVALDAVDGHVADSWRDRSDRQRRRDRQKPDRRFHRAPAAHRPMSRQDERDDRWRRHLGSKDSKSTKGSKSTKASGGGSRPHHRHNGGGGKHDGPGHNGHHPGWVAPESGSSDSTV